LEGRNDELVTGLRERMAEAASGERFEQAAQLRDAIRVIETVGTRQQKMASVELGDRDAFGLKVGPAGAIVQIFQVRSGRVVERIELVAEAASLERRVSGEGGADAQPMDRESEVLEAAVQQFYADRTPPPEIHLPSPLADADAEMLEGWLSARAAR